MAGSRAKQVRLAATVALLYALLCVAFAKELTVLETILEHCPGWVLAILLTAIGPGAIFSFAAGWGWIAASVFGLVAVCLGFAWVSWRVWPESELFAVGILAALVVWGASPWLAAAVAGI